MERRLRRLLDESGVAPASLPNADIYETGDEFVIELEVPGFEEKELAIEAHDHTLFVKGERTEEKEETEKNFQLHERLEKRFERRFTLPTEADVDKVTAKCGKGILEIHAAKATPATPKKVTISTK